MASNGQRAVDLLVIVGPSGAGKSTLIKQLMQDHEGAFGYSVSHTTRGAREGEVNGTSYHFVKPEEFSHLIEEKQFLEHATVHNTSYGTSEMSVKTVLKENRVVCMDLDIKGAQRLRLHPSFKTCIVFVNTPSHAELERRLRGRGTESETRIQTRLTNAHKEVRWFEGNSAFFDHAFVNDDFGLCYEQFHEAVTNACFAGGLPIAAHSR